MTWTQDLEKSGVAPRQHWDETYELHERLVTYSCRLIAEEHEGRENWEPGSLGDDVGHVLWHVINGHRGNLSAWSPAFSCLVAGAPAEKADSSTTRTRADSSADPGPLLLPDYGAGLTDNRFLPKQVNDQAVWVSKPYLGQSGILTAGTSEYSQAETFHASFEGIASASRDAFDYSTNVFDLDSNARPDPNYIAPFHTGLVVESIKELSAGKGVAVGDVLATPLNGLGAGASSGGAYVYGANTGDRTLLPMSWEAGGPITWSDPFKHTIGKTEDGAIMPAAIKTEAFFRSNQNCGPIEFHDSAPRSDMLRGYLMWKQDALYSWAGGRNYGTWQIHVDGPISVQDWDIDFGGVNGETWNPGNQSGGVIRNGAGGRQVPPGAKGPDGRPANGRNGGPGGEPAGGPSGAGGDADRAPDAGGRAPLPPSTGGDGGLPRFGHASGRRPGGESQAEANARFAGFGFGFSGTGQSTRNRRRSPTDGFGLPGSGGGGDDGPPRHTQHGVTVTPPPTRAEYEAAHADAVARRLNDLAKQIRDAKSDRARQRLRDKRNRLRGAQKEREERNVEKAEKRAKAKAKKESRQRVARKGAPGLGGGGAGAFAGGVEGGLVSVGDGGVLTQKPIIRRLQMPLALIGNAGVQPSKYYAMGDITQQGYQDFGARNHGAGATRGGGGNPPVSGRFVGYGNHEGGVIVAPAGGVPSATSGGVMFLPPDGTVLDALAGNLQTVAGSFSSMLFPPDVTGIKFGTPTSGGSMVAGTQMYQIGGTGFSMSPVTSAGTVAPNGIEQSYGETGNTYHGESRVDTFEGDVIINGKMSCDWADPRGYEYTGVSSRPAEYDASNWGTWVDSATDILYYWDGATDSQIPTVASGGGLPQWHVQGLEITVADEGDTDIIVGIGECRDRENGSDISLTSATTIDISLGHSASHGWPTDKGLDEIGLDNHSSPITCSQSTFTITASGAIWDTGEGNGKFTPYLPTNLVVASTSGTTFTGGTRIDLDVKEGDLIGNDSLGWSRVTGVTSSTTASLAAALPGGDLSSAAWSVIHNATIWPGTNTAHKCRIDTLSADGLSIVQNTSSQTLSGGSDLTIGVLPSDNGNADGDHCWLAIWVNEDGDSPAIASTQHVVPLSAGGIGDSYPERPYDWRMIGWVLHHETGTTGLLASRTLNSGGRRVTQIESYGGGFHTIAPSVTTSWADKSAGTLQFGAGVPRKVNHALAQMSMRFPGVGTVGCRVNHSTTQTVNNVTVTTLTWNTEVQDDAAMHSTSVNPSRITVGNDGWYAVACGLTFPSNATGHRWMSLYVDGVQRDMVRWDAVGTAQTDLFLSAVIPLAATSYCEIKVYQNSGSNLACGGASAVNSHFTVSALGDNSSVSRYLYFRAREHGDTGSTTWGHQMIVHRGQTVSDQFELPVDGAGYFDSVASATGLQVGPSAVVGWVDKIDWTIPTVA